MPRQCGSESLGIEEYAGVFDFALASAVVHESPAPVRLVRDVCASLKPGGIFMIAEPSGHVTPGMFEETVAAAISSGMICRERKTHRRYYLGVFEKK